MAGDSTLPNLPSGSAIADADLFYSSQGGASVKQPASALKTYIGPGVSPANPTASVGLTAVNGVAVTYMRSDAAPALDQTAAYAFSGLGATNLLSASLLSWNSDVNINRSAAGTLQIGTTAANASGTLNLAALVVGSGGVVRWNNRTKIFSSADAEVQWQNNAQSLSTYFYFPTSGTFQLGQAPAASPVPQALQAQGSRPGTDSNVGGANLTDQPGTGTGTGALAQRIFKTPRAVVSGTGAQTQTTTLTMVDGVTQRPGLAFASLPAAPSAGMEAYITDSTTNAWGATIAGGGSNPVMGWFNGAAWTVIGK